MSTLCTDIAPSVDTPSQPASSASTEVGREIGGLFRASSHYLAGLLGKLGIGFISLPIFTRIFSISDYGLIDLAGKVLLFLTALSKMGLQNSTLRFFNGKAFDTDP